MTRKKGGGRGRGGRRTRRGGAASRRRIVLRAALALVIVAAMAWLGRAALFGFAVAWKMEEALGLDVGVGRAERLDARTLELHDVEIDHPRRGGPFVAVRRVVVPFENAVLSLDPGAIGLVRAERATITLEPGDLEGFPPPRDGDGEGTGKDGPATPPFAGLELTDSEIRLVVPLGEGRDHVLPVTGVALRLMPDGAGGWRLEDAVADLLGGRVRLHGAGASADDWRAQAAVAGADLGRVAGTGGWPDAFAGALDGFVELRGVAAADRERSGPMTGAGWLRVRRGALWELPVFADVLGVLGLIAGSGDRVDALAVDFRVDAHRLHLLEVEARGAPLGLWGRGSVGLDGHGLDVALLPRVAEGVTRSLPVVGEPVQALLDLVNGSAVELRVTGDLADPRVETVPVPMLTDPVRSLVDLFEGR